MSDKKNLLQTTKRKHPQSYNTLRNDSCDKDHTVDNIGDTDTEEVPPVVSTGYDCSQS